MIAAIATAIDDNGEPDCARSIALARFLLANGCDGLNVLGTTGEATSFSLEQRRRVMSAYAASGLPLDRMMVGTGAAAIADAIALTRHAAELGFAGALVLPPFYYKGVHDDGLLAYIEAIMTATAARPIPIYLYHFPAQSGLPWHVALIRRLLDAFGERIAGLKDSSGDMAFAREAASIAPRFKVFPVDRGGAAAGPFRPVRRLHLGDRQSQRRPLRPRLPLGRCRGAGRSGRDPQAVRRQAAGRRREGAARPHPRRRAMGARGAAAVGLPRGRPRGWSAPLTRPCAPSAWLEEPAHRRANRQQHKQAALTAAPGAPISAAQGGKRLACLSRRCHLHKAVV